MSFGENISSLHASDLVSAGQVSPRGSGADEERQETRHLREENKHLRLCLSLMREQAQLETANLISSVIAWCDDKFRKKFAEMSLAQTSGQRVQSPFRPISPPATSIALRTSGHQYDTMGSTFTNLTTIASPLTTSQLGGRSQGTDQANLVASSLDHSRSPDVGSRQSPKYVTSSYSPTHSPSRQYQSSGTGTLSQAGTTGPSPHSFMSDINSRSSPVGNAGGRPPSPRVPSEGVPVGNVHSRPASPTSTFSNETDRPAASIGSSFGGENASIFSGQALDNSFDRPTSPRSTFISAADRLASPRSTFNNVCNRLTSPRSTLINTLDQPPSPRSDHNPSPKSVFSNISDRPSSPKPTFEALAEVPVSPTLPDHPASPRQTSGSSSPYSIKYGTDLNSQQPRTDQSGHQYDTMGSAFTNLTTIASPLTTSQLGGRSQGTDQANLVASSLDHSRSPDVGSRQSPKYVTSSYSPTHSPSRQYQSSGTGTLSQAGTTGPSPHSFMSDINSRSSPVGNAGGRPPSPRVPSEGVPVGNVHGRPASPISTFSNVTDRPAASIGSSFGGENASIFSGQALDNSFDRPTSPRSTFISAADRLASLRSAFNNVSNRPTSPRSTLINTLDRPPSPRSDHNPSPKSVFSNISDRPSSPKPTFEALAEVPVSPTLPDHPASPRQTSGSSSPYSIKYGTDLNSQQPRTDQSVHSNVSPIFESESQPPEEVARRLQFNQVHDNPSVKLPREAEVLAAGNSPFAGSSNFSATLEMHDLSATLASLDRPESSAFVTSVNDPSFQGHKAQTSLIKPQPGHSFGLKPYSTQGTSASFQLQTDDNKFIRPPSPREQSRFSPLSGQTPSQPYKDTGSSFDVGHGTQQGFSSFKVPHPPSYATQPPSYATQPTYRDGTSSPGVEQTEKPRSLTPFPDMHTTSLPSNMLYIKEEMELEMRSRSPSPVNINKYTEQLFGQPVAASTPKKARTTSPGGVKSSRTGKRTPSPRGKRSPSPLSDDSFKAQSRRSATIVKPSHRILGEIAFQLERRILDYVFARYKTADSRVRGRRRFYGYTVSNIPIMIHKESLRHDGTIDMDAEFQMKYRLKYIVTSLGPFGYQLDRHAIFAQEMINKYGLLNNAPDRKTLEAFGLASADTLREFVARLASTKTEKRDILILLECLFVLANDDDRPLFLW